LTYTIPEIHSEDPKVQAITEAWIPKLTQYLHGHGELAEEYAVMIDEKIDSMKPQKTCEEVNLLASEYANDILDDLSKAIKKYNQGNKYGASEYAWLQQYLEDESTE
jgi:predicted secreted Zn-dependent protease